jgi:pantoate--beta-alanine ligase
MTQKMKKATSPAEAAGILAEVRRKDLSIGLVPTMGALHEGHISLVKMSLARSDYTAVSIFVNPKQFGEGEDLDEYPRTEDKDATLLEELGCDLLFMPGPGSLYSDSDRTSVSLSGLGDYLCGAERPGHFDGVLLVVSKLFNIIRPDYAFFGQKDAQQAVIIQRMAADLDFPVRIFLGPTVREEDGLAMSSRNRYLSREERAKAPKMRAGLLAAAGAIEKGERDASALKDIVTASMDAGGFEIDYVECVDGGTLQPLQSVDGTVLLAAAGKLGATRLIDNIAMEVGRDGAAETLLEFPEWSRYEG